MTALPMDDVRPESVVSIEFAGTTIPVVMHEGQPFVAIRPICDALKLTWASQYLRIKRNVVLGSVVFIMKTTASDGKQYETGR
ncbi:MAG: P22AR N-terminal domain protein [Rhodospirillaceae bacterium]|nr:MAG: P22AR N-terminal domain protein [Rhodospirillaceae bacterium]